MSSKYHCKHPDRTHYGYRRRLRKRGLSKTPVMEPIEGTSGLRARQKRREDRTGFLWPTHDDD